MLTNYATKSWQKKLKKLKGTKKAFKKLKATKKKFRKHYSAAWRREAGTTNPKGTARKTKAIGMDSRPSRKQMFSCNQIETILTAATAMVKAAKRSWEPVSQARNHVQSKAREAFEEAAYRLKEKPSHVSTLLTLKRRRHAVGTHWFTRVVHQDFDVSKGVKNRIRAAYNNLYAQVLECEIERKNRNRN